jgi:hypothetical protein
MDRKNDCDIQDSMNFHNNVKNMCRICISNYILLERMTYKERIILVCTS